VTADGSERALRLTRARLDSLVTFHPDGVFCLDLEGRFTSVNAEALLQSGGYRSEDLLGSSFVDLLYEGDVPQVVEHFATLLAGRAETFEVRFRRADDTEGELEIIGLPIVVDDEVVEIYGIAEDITQRKRDKQALDDARRAAEAASEAKSAFLATMSHEIRTPLTAVLAAAELLSDSDLSPQQQRLLTVMERSGERLLRLVDDVLDFSRIEAGRVDLTPAPFVVGELVDESVLILRSAIEDKGLALEVGVDPALAEPVVGDRRRIAQVLTNLLDNAVKFTHEGSIGVRVSAVDPEPGDREGTIRIRFAVTDTGIGLALEHLDVVFEHFRQGDSSVTREYGGTGLGLAISRRLVDRMGGRLGVESTPGTGSTFSFDVPLGLV
jgi:PAS domain S-box-containing protein